MTSVDQIVNAVLYEGYMLYPYRRSAIKNRQRWNFGVLYPRGYRGEPDSMTTECLCVGTEPMVIRSEVRFLQLSTEDGQWQDAAERRIAFDVCPAAERQPFTFGPIRGMIEAKTERVKNNLLKIRVHVANAAEWKDRADAKRDDALYQSMVSTHIILNVDGGEWVSLLETPDEFREPAMHCQNCGTWPVLVGAAPQRNCMLSSPIILYDYPQVAPESPGDLFDGAEIDELLTLRILTLTDGEKAEMCCADERTRQILERAESLTPEQFMKLHGAVRETKPGLRRGARVRLHPKAGGDVFDAVLSGRIAIVEAVEHDLENRTHVAVVIEDDPGKDLGLMRQPGHRFFFSAEEVELIA